MMRLMPPAAPQTQPHRSKPRRAKLGKAPLVGAATLSTIVIACLAGLPWATARTAPAEGAATAARRFEAPNLNATLLPPSWASHRADERERVDEGGVGFAAFGTDALGRDVLARCVMGGAISLLIGFAAACIAVGIGTLYGAFAGYIGGRIDAVMMRIVDVLFGLPYILLVVLLAVAVDGWVSNMRSVVNAEPGEHVFAEFILAHGMAVNVITLLIAIGGVSWLTMARVVRGQVLSLKEQPFMEACRAVGVPVHVQFIRHLLPNLTGPIVVYATLTVPQAILQESFLSFLGIGVQPPLPSWGNLAADGLSELNPVRARWWLLLFPCLLLAITLLSLSFLGEGLRAVFDPKRPSAQRT